ncbi:MAG: dltA, partial [Paenibacillaceae bacterium]|nr:dltA [Paenibacillaceae bacterium]
LYRGDILFLRSTVIPEWFEPVEPETWLPFVEGLIEKRDIACRHKDMCQPGPLKEMGPFIQEALRKSEYSKRGDGIHESL